ncbi:hypothetical protein G3257_11420 [Janthinobacterium lividum]|nr:hypothetical protein [Janthinobacterium lividum]QKY02790.1 hypothetical protein G3257_11420 [Janthinobacterium lividum]
MNKIDPKVVAAIDQARDVFTGVPDGIQSLDYLAEVLKAASATPDVAAPAPAMASNIICKLVMEVDTSQVDAALVKVGQLNAAMGIADAAPMDVDSKGVEDFMATFQAALIPLPKCVADSFNHCLLSLLESARLEFTNSGHVVAGGACRGGVVLRILGARELLAAALAAAQFDLNVHG